MSELVEQLGGLEVGDHVRVTTTDETTFEGTANPIDYVPGESLRVEVRPTGGQTDRYEIRATHEGEWSDLHVRHTDAGEANATWEDLGTVERVETGEDDWDWGTSEE